MEVDTVDFDLANDVFQVYASNSAGEAVVRKTLRRDVAR